MEMKQIITATVAVILVCLVAVPIIDDASKTISTEMQNSTERYIVASSSSTGTHTIEITETAVLWDGEPQQQFLTDNPGRCGSTENIVIASLSTIGVNLTVWENGSTPTQYSLNTAGDNVTFNNGTAVITKNGATVSTTTYNTLIMPSVDGDYGCFRGTPSFLEESPIHVDHGKPIYGIGAPYTSPTDNGMYLISVTDGNARTIAGYNYDGSTISTKTYTIDFLMEEGDISDTFRSVKVDGAIVFYLFAPLTYHIITDQQGVTITLLELIPVLLVAAVIIGIGYSIMRRD